MTFDELLEAYQSHDWKMRSAVWHYCPVCTYSSSYGLPGHTLRERIDYLVEFSTIIPTCAEVRMIVAHNR